MSRRNTKKIEPAIEELKSLVRTHYPTATFEVEEGGEPDGTYLIARVDVDDTDEVMDKVVDRLVTLQVDERLPLYFIPLPTPERAARQFEAYKAANPLPKRVRKIMDALP